MFNNVKHSLCEEGPNTELFLIRVFLYSVRIQENTDQKNSVFGHFSRNDCDEIYIKFGDRFFTPLTMLAPELKGSISSTIKENLFLYYRKFSAFAAVLIV